MTELGDLCTNLQTIWHEQIPLSKAMDMRIESFADHVLTCRASLGPNVNVHGTAFAGSLYAVQALTGWGMMHLQLQLNALDASIVIANGNIDYANPVAEDIVVQCAFGEHEAETGRDEKPPVKPASSWPAMCCWTTDPVPADSADFMLCD